MLKFELKITAFAGTVEALTALKRGRCVGLLYDDTAIGAVGKDHEFKKVNDEETRRALFPSNYPPV
jgi:hypothetical protein